MPKVSHQNRPTKGKSGKETILESYRGVKIGSTKTESIGFPPDWLASMDFDDIAHKYDAWFATPLGAAVDRWEKTVTWSLAKPKVGEKVLDIGTGTANYLIELAEMGLDCTGLDIGFKMLVRAREKSLRKRLGLKLVAAHSEHLPFPDGCFDLVLSITAFEFFQDPARSVKEMTRVCRPGGRIVVGVLNKWSVWAARRRLLSWFRETIFTRCRFYSCLEMKALFGPMQWATAAFAPPGLPSRLVPLFDRLEPFFRKGAKPFGAYLVVRKEVTPAPYRQSS
jgi:ubiquinone/menaquinone biosynthesis C-methylase UbiE